MERISENLRTISLKKFSPTGNSIEDVKELCRQNGQNPERMPHGMPIILRLRMELGDPLTVHVLTDAVCKKIQRVKIEHLPSEYPLFLKKPFLLEAKPGNVLFDDIDAIGGYIEMEVFTLVMWAKSGTYFSRMLTPFTGIRIDQIKFELRSNSLYPPADQNKNVFPFLSIFALMLEAEKTPIIVDHGNKKSKKRNKAVHKNSNISEWVEYRVLIDAKYTSKKIEDTVPMTKDNKEKQEVFVQGFLRHQAHGPEHSLRKWIYVEGYDSTRWKKTGDKKITLDTLFK